MNCILGHITHKLLSQGCALLCVQTELGAFHTLVVENEEFMLNDSVSLSFKENDVFVSDISHFASIPNRFEGVISSVDTQGFFTRVCIQPPTNHKPIYALIASPNTPSFHQNIAWYVSCAHIVLEKVL